MATNPELDSKLEGQAPQEPTVTLKLTVNELNVIVGGLQEMPHRIVDGLLRNIIGQAQAQLQQ